MHRLKWSFAMRAVYIKEFGGIKNLEVREVGNPKIVTGTGVLVRVKAAALNRADLLQRRGLYPPPPGVNERIPGLEFSGEVAAVGEDVCEFEIGDRVFGITAGGAQAEFTLTEARLLVKIPEKLNFIEAAAVPEAFITAHDAIFTNGALRENETLLIHAIGSGVGLAALQLARAKNINTIGTSRSADKLLKAGMFGLNQGLAPNAASDDPVAFAVAVRGKNGGNGVDVILDLVGAKYLQANLESLNLKGRLVLVGTTSGAKAELNFGLVLKKRLKLIGTVLRSRTLAEKADATSLFRTEVVPLLEDGRIRPNIDSVFGVEDVQRAHAYLESNANFGKVVLEF